MNNLKKVILALSILLTTALLIVSCKTDSKILITVNGIIGSNNTLSTLEAAITKAQLTATLAGTGPYTVFAPTNESFVDAGITSLATLTAANLTPILTSHVLSGTVKAPDVKSGVTKTLNANNNIYLTKNAQGVWINGKIKVISSEEASNGIVHVIDHVITIPTDNIVAVAADPRSGGNFTELLELANAADVSVVNSLKNASVNGFTLFAPPNDAFKILYKTYPKAQLLANKALITKILLYHVVPGRVFSSDLLNVGATEVTSATGTDKLSFDLTGDAKVKGTSSGISNIVDTDILATNGVIHIVDKVLVPKL
jgi:uncharacterized surface protein with fasciclin (FAS1) repeats